MRDFDLNNHGMLQATVLHNPLTISLLRHTTPVAVRAGLREIEQQKKESAGHAFTLV